jgi:hypothetical protein
MTGIDEDGFFIAPPGYAMIMGSADGQTRIDMVREPVQELCAFLARVV